MGRLLGSILCLAIGAFLGVHGFTNLNLSDTDPSAMYEVIRGGRATGIVLSGEYVYSSGKALTALVSVPFVFSGVLLLYSMVTGRVVSDRLWASVIAGSVLSLPIDAIVFGNLLNILNPITSALVCITCMVIVWFGKK